MTDTSLRSFAQHVEAVRPRIDAALDHHSRMGKGCPAPLAEAMRYALLGPGKRLRPLLVLLAAEACDDDSETAMPAACAVEMVHAYSLIHDDLPAMDDDDLRRGRPTCHKVFGEAMAILAGDALFALAFETLTRLDVSSQTVAACCGALAKAAGACQLAGGQADDIAGLATGLDVAPLEAIHQRKTGAMIEVSLKLGGLIAGADQTQLAALAEYGRSVGLAFQIVDDLLDVRGDEAAVGKRVGKDSDYGKLTFPGILGIDESTRRAEALVDAGCEAIRRLSTPTDHLAMLARYVLERNR
ncbi:MAG: polyprenyl synthetase family protein [Pirellulales bacterium]|nr:polyprenyl synthetase family protein [Pirellulales bacterium]